MPHRTGIISDTARTSFMERCIMQYDNDVRDHTPLIHDATATAMKTALTQWRRHIQRRGQAAADRMPAVAAKEEAKTECSRWISHFFQVMRLWSRRELGDDGIGKFYSTDVMSKPSSVCRTDDEVLIWGKRIIEGEKKRVAEGGLPMQNPAVITFMAVYERYRQRLQEVQKKKAELDQAEDTVRALRPPIDALIGDAMAEMEFALRRAPAAARRRKMRRYGVRYYRRNSEPKDHQTLPFAEPQVESPSRLRRIAG
ncbi:MAG: hypothetical protein EHM72_13245 [Calditrichaeota bacterium]|nr:MAG: hypothetical protein EHM72_13245 [Calditrichota bacterium]